MVKINKSMAALIDRTAPPIPQCVSQCADVTIKQFVLQSKEYIKLAADKKELEGEKNKLEGEKNKLAADKKELAADKKKLEGENKELEGRYAERQRLCQKQLYLAKDAWNLATLQLVQSKTKLKEIAAKMNITVQESQTMVLKSAKALQEERLRWEEERVRWEEEKEKLILFRRDLQKQLVETKFQDRSTTKRLKSTTKRLKETEQVESDLRTTITEVNEHLEKIHKMLKNRKYIK